MVAVTVIVAATLATFLALFLTSRPYDPMDSTIAPHLNGKRVVKRIYVPDKLLNLVVA